MTTTIQTILFLLAVLVVVAVAARRLNTAPSILLVAAGIGLALIPGLPRIELAPELVLLGILPPLIYAAGVAMSWREFRFNLRPITLLAFGCVVFTSGAVAAAVHFLLGMPVALGFVLGAIVAPTERYGYVARGASASADEELRYIVQVRDQYYPFLAALPVPLSAANHERYGVSSTPTVVILDRHGIVRLYHPGRLTEDELEAALRPLLNAGGPGAAR
jgi:hypothetical protein